MAAVLKTMAGIEDRRLAERIEAGTVCINESVPSTSQCPFGGMKASGNGREGGVWGLEDFLEVKAVSGWASESSRDA